MIQPCQFQVAMTQSALQRRGRKYLRTVQPCGFSVVSLHIQMNAQVQHLFQFGRCFFHSFSFQWPHDYDQVKILWMCEAPCSQGKKQILSLQTSKWVCWKIQYPKIQWFIFILFIGTTIYKMGISIQYKYKYISKKIYVYMHTYMYTVYFIFTFKTIRKKRFR